MAQHRDRSTRAVPDDCAIAIPVELAIGGTPAPGLVLGIGSYGVVWPAPHDKLKNYGQSFESDAGPILLSSLGPFLDYYVNPSQGLHAQVAATFVNATAAKSRDSQAAKRIPAQDLTGTGWSLVGGFGWESWIGEQWSAGILGRVQYGHATLKGTDSRNELSASFLVLGAIASFTYH